jgi:hypothetical protein
MAEKDNWDSICKFGLLSTTALLDLFEYGGDQRFEIESELRRKAFEISHRVYGTAIIRDQDPLKDRPEKGISLEKCLNNTTRREWFELLNRNVFFWATIIGLKFMLNARLYRRRSHLVFTVDTKKLVAKYERSITLTGLNTGSLYGKEGPKPRSKDSFNPIHHFSQRWVREVAVDYSVPDIFSYTNTVEEQQIQGQNIKTIRRIWP